MVKNLAGAVIIGADILFGAAAPEVFKNLHKETQSHVYGSVGLYIGLALLTLWVLVSVARTMSGAAAAKGKPAPRAGYPYGSGR